MSKADILDLVSVAGAEFRRGVEARSAAVPLATVVPIVRSEPVEPVVRSEPVEPVEPVVPAEPADAAPATPVTSNAGSEGSAAEVVSLPSPMRALSHEDALSSPISVLAGGVGSAGSGRGLGAFGTRAARRGDRRAMTAFLRARRGQD